jgi:hypothetical protein
MPTKVVKSADSIKNYFYLTIGLALITLSSGTDAWPWGDASKYRNECYESCIEDSFGKAKVAEINLRCNNKCNSLPYSPKDQWEFYDSYVRNKDQAHKKLLNSQHTRDSCRAKLAVLAKGCEKEIGVFRDSCVMDFKKTLPKNCADAEIDEIIYKNLYRDDYEKPSVPRPKK